MVTDGTETPWSFCRIELVTGSRNRRAALASGCNPDWPKAPRRRSELIQVAPGASAAMNESDALGYHAASKPSPKALF